MSTRLVSSKTKKGHVPFLPVWVWRRGKTKSRWYLSRRNLRSSGKWQWNHLKALKLHWVHGFRVHASESFPKLTTVNSLIPPEELQNSKKEGKESSSKHHFEESDFLNFRGCIQVFWCQQVTFPKKIFSERRERDLFLRVVRWISWQASIKWTSLNKVKCWWLIWPIRIGSLLWYLDLEQASRWKIRKSSTFFVLLFLCFLQIRDRAASDRSVAILVDEYGIVCVCDLPIWEDFHDHLTACEHSRVFSFPQS